MKIAFAFVLSFFASTASAAGMFPVDEKLGFCAEKQGICYEWALTQDHSIRFIAYGSEQGIDYSFFKLKSNQYRQLLRVFPVLRDPSHRNVLFWAYPEDIKDIVIAPSDLRNRLLATYRHSIIDDGEVASPKWQKRIPAVLFTGATSQPQMRVKPITFRAITVEALRHSGQ